MPVFTDRYTTGTRLAHLLNQLRRRRSPRQQVVAPWQHDRWRSKLELGASPVIFGPAGIAAPPPWRWPRNGAAKEATQEQDIPAWRKREDVTGGLQARP